MKKILKLIKAIFARAERSQNQTVHADGKTWEQMISERLDKQTDNEVKEIIDKYEPQQMKTLEFTQPNRPIDNLVIHCTATPENRHHTADEVRRWHTDPAPRGNGWRQVGYSDLILLDGTCERMTADEWAVTNGVAGHNARSRHICYVGGLATDGRTAKDTRTPQQVHTLAVFVKEFHARFPNVRIVGHNELAGKACPSFDVQKWLKSIGINQ